MKGDWGGELGTQTFTGRGNWGHRPSQDTNLPRKVGGFGKGVQEGMCLQGAAQVSVQATVGTSAPLPGFCEFQLLRNVWH